MLDPIPPPPRFLQDLVTPWAERLHLYSLPYHIHEVVALLIFYQFLHSYVSPRLSKALFPRHYPQLPRRTQLNWDIHVVSLVQSVLVTSVALWVMITDRERKEMTLEERIYGYTGAGGLVQAMATAYFVYDLIVSAIHVKMFGLGMLFHGISALCVFTLGFVRDPLLADKTYYILISWLCLFTQRPFINFYAPTFILYELSSPLLNIHWFLDKVNMTGSRLQWYNGMFLLASFFTCRLVWGTWQSVIVYTDMWKAIGHRSRHLHDGITTHAPIFQMRNGTLCVDEACARANAEVSRFAHLTDNALPLWLPLTYVASNLVLNGLNYYWFSVMIDAVLKRFRAPAKKIEKEDVTAPEADIVIDAAERLERQSGYYETGDRAEKYTSAVNVSDETLRKRKS